MDIAKLDAARRQLETAINLYFHEGDPVSVHTLTCAAYAILRPINKDSGTPMLKDWMRDYIYPDYREDFGKKLQEAEVFFKHGYPNLNGTVTFQPGQSNILLLDACWAYKRLANERLPLLAIFEIWAALTWAKNFVTYEGIEQFGQSLQEWAAMSRQEFFGTFLPIAYRAIVVSPVGSSGSHTQ